MTPTEWTHVDTSGESLHDAVAAPDLFGGVLFGDELMDIYNSEAVVEDDNGNVAGHEITELLSSANESGPPGKDDEQANDPSSPVHVPSADDGFGAFRPSTSFNDLTTLLAPAVPETATSSGSVATTTLTVPSNPTAPLSKKTTPRKRAVSDGVVAGSAAKKRATGPPRAKVASAPSGSGRRGEKAKPMAVPKISTSKRGSQPANQTALKLRKEQQAALAVKKDKSTNNTPNPLVVQSCVAAVVPPTTAQAKPPGFLVTKKPAPSKNAKGDSITSDAAAAVAASVGLTPTSKSKTTESDFTSVAKAAVTNLILNASSNSKISVSAGDNARSSTDSSRIKVDTSTAHIKSLTSSNWVNACGTSAEGGTIAAPAESKATNRARRQNLTPDERARQNRDRNREHARNTRLRKKAYVEELKRTLTELVSQRDAADLEKRHSAQREMEQREVRFRVMEEFLKLRGRNEPNFARWVAILEEGFHLTLPVTTYRTMVHDDSVCGAEQVMKGPGEVMTDSSNLSSFLQSLGSLPDSSSGPITLLHHCERKDFFMDGSTAVLQWTASTVGAVEQGAPNELSVKGTMRAKFSPASNKLLSAEILFDTGSVVSQLASLLPSEANAADTCNADAIAAAAAAQAAHQADVLLDSLEMPHLSVVVPSAITVGSHVKVEASAAVSVSSADITPSERGELSSDESMGEPVGKSNEAGGALTRRSGRIQA